MLWSNYPRRSDKRKRIPQNIPKKNKQKIAIAVSPEEEVKEVLIKRVKGIKEKNARSIANLVDRAKYTKFDDWPPFIRQNLDALKREAEAFKVLKEYDYNISDWKIDVFGDTALASFLINYRGIIRDLKFKINSRVTVFLVKQEGGWKLIHEHWSRRPEA